MAHGTIRASTLKTIIPLVMDHFKCTENEALKLFYESHIGACYCDDSTGLYGQSALYVFSLLCEEKASNNTLI
ncbi:MAG: hypothetical protein FWB73_05605 [Treponema sp.]|nr:hypothetical protein [Treponema sp.]